MNSMFYLRKQNFIFYFLSNVSHDLTALMTFNNFHKGVTKNIFISMEMSEIITFTDKYFFPLFNSLKKTYKQSSGQDVPGAEGPDELKKR